MSNENPSFEVSLQLIDGFRFLVDFGDAGQLVTDEPEPLGEGKGPNPSKLLAASVANCLAASLMFAVQKFKEDPGKVTAKIHGELSRIDRRWRIEHMNVELTLGNAPGKMPHLERALSQFEDFCVVTQSVRQGIDVTVTVRAPDGSLLT
jgi:uncharacterized OsmC-like protein